MGHDGSGLLKFLCGLVVGGELLPFRHSETFQRQHVVVGDHAVRECISQFTFVLVQWVFLPCRGSIKVIGLAGDGAKP